MAQDPFELFREWMAEAASSEPNDPNAMTLATATPDGAPSARIVLLKGVDARGFVFYTNKQSRKGEELGGQPARRAAVPLEVARAAGPHRGRGGGRDGCRGGCVFREPRPHLAARRAWHRTSPARSGTGRSSSGA